MGNKQLKNSTVQNFNVEAGMGKMQGRGTGFFLLGRMVQGNVSKHPRAQKCFPDKFSKKNKLYGQGIQEKRNT